MGKKLGHPNKFPKVYKSFFPFFIMEKNPDETQPSIIDAVIGTEEEALWQKVKDETDKIIQKLENDLTINRAIRELAIEKTKDKVTLNLTDGSEKSSSSTETSP